MAKGRKTICLIAGETGDYPLAVFVLDIDGYGANSTEYRMRLSS